MAPSLRVDVSPVNMRDAGEIERAIKAFASSLNGGLIVTGSALAEVHRDLIVAMTDKLPALYFNRFFVAAGGLVSYGSDLMDQYRRAASTSTASSRARSPLTCRCRRRPNTSS